MKQPDDTAHADIGIVSAVPMEMAEFLRRCTRVRSYTGGTFAFRGGQYDRAKIVIVEAGMGADRARRATEAIIAAHTPNWILSCGFSGGLQPDIPVRSIVVATELVDESGTIRHVDAGFTSDASRHLYVGRTLTLNRVVRFSSEKKALGQEMKALAVDMESFAVASVCHELKKRFLAIRVISDSAEKDLPEEVLSLVGSTGSIRMGAVVGALWKRPGSMFDMLQLREDANACSLALASFLDGVITQLATAK